jgi:hypothetical protein
LGALAIGSSFVGMAVNRWNPPRHRGPEGSGPWRGGWWSL